MSLHCPKCKAGCGSLAALVRHLESGVRLQVVKCVICGWEASRIQHHAYTERPFAGRKFSAATAVCTRVGCNGTFLANKSRRKLCSACSKKYSSWKTLTRRGLTRRPAPFVRQGEVWIDNPEQQKEVNHV